MWRRHTTGPSRQPGGWPADPQQGANPPVTPPPTDALSTVIAWLRAHEFPDADRVAPGSSVVDATGLRGRLWSELPSEQELVDLLDSTPDGSWPVAVFAREPEQALLRRPPADAVAALTLDSDGTLRAANARGHELVDWIGARQRAQSFTTRALSVLAAERPQVADGSAGSDASAPVAEPSDASAQPKRSIVHGVHETPPTPMMAARAAVEDPQPEPDPEALEAADLEKKRRIDDMRRQRELRKSVKHR
jgi:hypothetical protein